MFTNDEIRAAAERLRGYSMNPHLGLGEWYPAHPGSDSPAQDSQRAFLRDLRAVAELAIASMMSMGDVSDVRKSRTSLHM